MPMEERAGEGDPSGPPSIAIPAPKRKSYLLKTPRLARFSHFRRQNLAFLAVESRKKIFLPIQTIVPLPP